MDRRTFIGSIVAAVAGLIGVKRSEAKPTSFSMIGADITPRPFGYGDIVWLKPHVRKERGRPWIFVVTGMLRLPESVEGITGSHDDYVQLDGAGWSGMLPASWLERTDGLVLNVDEIVKGDYYIYVRGGEQAVLCKPTETVKRGYTVAQTRMRFLLPKDLPDCYYSETILGPYIYSYSTVLGKATRDCFVPSGSRVSGVTAEWPAHKWLWLVPGVPKVAGAVIRAGQPVYQDEETGRWMPAT